uniref:Uncharacterized protein n=1 Tax=Opuntia streptacantha TaxID=393608 RepID=A0A7C8YDA5_OPUST
MKLFFHCYYYCYLLRSTTTTLTLSVLCLARANFVSKMEASEQALSELSPPGATTASFPGDRGGDAGFSRLFRHILATDTAVPFETTSHRPSLARIRHSSSELRSITVTSGSGITYGFK